MNDFLKWITLCFALLSMLYVISQHDDRIAEIESSLHEVCVTTQWLLTNRPIPKIHSYARDLPVCKGR